MTTTLTTSIEKMNAVVFNKETITTESIHAFDLSSKGLNDKNNKTRENIVAAIINGKIPKATTTSCCCGSSMLYASAEGYIMPCSLGFDHNNFKDCSIHKKTIMQILDEKPIYRKINENIGLCRETGVCKLFNEKIKGTFYD